MLSQSTAIELYKEFLCANLQNENWFQEIKEYIYATLLYGSVAKGTNREDSDIDILMIVPLAIEERYTGGEYFYKFQNQEINIVLRSIEKLRQIAKDKKDAFQKEVFRESIIINSKDDKVKTLLKEINSIN